MTAQSKLIVPDFTKDVTAPTTKTAEKPKLKRRMSIQMENGKRRFIDVTVDHKGVDPKTVLLDKFKGVDGIDGFVQFTRILVAVYAPPAPDRSDGGILFVDTITEEDREENKTQSKVGLILAMGSRCYVDDENTKFHNIKNQVGDWVWFRPTDGMPTEINGQLCRVFREADIIGPVPHPDAVW